MRLKLLAALLCLIAAVPALVLIDWVVSVRRAQALADRYAVWYADELAHGRPLRLIEPAEGVRFRIENPPAAGAYAGRTEAVQILLIDRRISPLSVAPRAIRVRSTAAMLRDGTPDGAWLVRVE